jgi:hypothetical protein
MDSAVMRVSIMNALRGGISFPVASPAFLRVFQRECQGSEERGPVLWAPIVCIVSV